MPRLLTKEHKGKSFERAFTFLHKGGNQFLDSVVIKNVFGRLLSLIKEDNYFKRNREQSLRIYTILKSQCKRNQQKMI